MRAVFSDPTLCVHRSATKPRAACIIVRMDIPIFDGHNDTLLNLYLPERGGGRTFFERSEAGHLDLPRARVGWFG